jgi:hypothetical protein
VLHSSGLFACALTHACNLGGGRHHSTPVIGQRTPPTLAGSTRGVKNAHILAKYRKDEHTTRSGGRGDMERRGTMWDTDDHSPLTHHSHSPENMRTRVQ